MVIDRLLEGAPQFHHALAMKAHNVINTSNMADENAIVGAGDTLR